MDFNFGFGGGGQNPWQMSAPPAHFGWGNPQGQQWGGQWGQQPQNQPQQHGWGPFGGGGFGGGGFGFNAGIGGGGGAIPPPQPGWGNWGQRKRNRDDGGQGQGQNQQSEFQPGQAVQANKTYSICIKRSTNDEGNWKGIVPALQSKNAKFNPRVHIYENDVTEVLEELRQALPYYTCFVAGPVENNREYLKKIHNITRNLTPGPYCDTIWGIVTGPDGATTTRIASQAGPLFIKKAMSNTSLAFDKIPEGTMFSENDQGQCNNKIVGNPKFVQGRCGGDLSEILAHELSDNNGKTPVDMLVTSSHATEHNWQIGYSYNAGYFVNDQANNMYAKMVDGGQIPIQSTNPKVLVAAGNCLMGNVVPGGCMALSWIKSANVVQMVGYTVESWFGYGGWGTLKYFVEMAGQFTLAEAFFANLQSLIRLKETHYGDDIPNFQKGLSYDETVMAFYGDPAFEARLVDPTPENGTIDNPYTMEFSQNGNTYTMRVRVNQDGKWDVRAGNDNHTKPGRPPCFIFPKRMQNARVVSGNIILTPLFAFFDVHGAAQAGAVLEATFSEN